MSADAVTFWIIIAGFFSIAVGFLCGWATFGKGWN
jgi:hypothetical protein